MTLKTGNAIGRPTYMAITTSASLNFATTHNLHARGTPMACVAARVARLISPNPQTQTHLLRRPRHYLQQNFQGRHGSYPRLFSKRGHAGVAFALDISFVEAPLTSIELAAEQIYSLVLDISESTALMGSHTRAGQYVQLRVAGSKPAYMSIASPPSSAASGSLEFLIKNVKGQTAGLLCNLSKGDKVEVSPCAGKGFAIENLYAAEDFPTVLLFATGTGISPVRSLIEAGFDAVKRSDVRLYYGTKNLQWMAYQDKFREWELSGVKVIRVLSQSDDDWTGEAGYVQAAFMKEKGIADPLRTGAILSGQKEMMEDVTSHLVAEGVLPEKILKNF